MLRVMLRFILLLCFVQMNLWSQEPSVSAIIDTNNVLIGDQVRLILNVRTNSGHIITWPAIPDTFGKIELVSKSKIDTSIIDDSRNLKQTIVLTAFDSGYYSIPSITFMYSKPGSEDLYPMQTNPLLLRFKAVEVDTTKPIKDIKPPMEPPFDFRELLIYLLVPLVLSAIAFCIWYIFFRRKKAKTQDSYDPRIPPYIIALEALKHLDNEKLWQKGEAKLYHIRLTEILRTYIERQMLIPALEQTSDEIINSLNSIKISDDLKSKLNKALIISDLVKFAKSQPLPDEHALCMDTALEFINTTYRLYEISDERGHNSSADIKRGDE